MLTRGTLYGFPVMVRYNKKREAITAMPGVERLSTDLVVEAAKEAASLGIPAIALFPNTPPALKSEDGREAVNGQNLICRTVRAINSCSSAAETNSA